mmetsp:Transcript_24119/g.38305  ORF Transcript_24119/g.38305 Transcript_24119/m.38305 type:complete len:199 (-) Transcript_24119:98-694(-)
MRGQLTHILATSFGAAESGQHSESPGGNEQAHAAQNEGDQATQENVQNVQPAEKDTYNPSDQAPPEPPEKLKEKARLTLSDLNLTLKKVMNESLMLESAAELIGKRNVVYSKMIKMVKDAEDHVEKIKVDIGETQNMFKKMLQGPPEPQIASIFFPVPVLPLLAPPKLPSRGTVSSVSMSRHYAKHVPSQQQSRHEFL